MCRSNGSLLYKKSLNMGPVFYQRILKHGSAFLTEPKFSGFRTGENTENHKTVEKWAYFSRKILKNGYPFLPKSPLKMGGGFEARAAHFCPTQIWVPPRDWVLSWLRIQCLNVQLPEWLQLAIASLGPEWPKSAMYVYWSFASFFRAIRRILTLLVTIG